MKNYKFLVPVALVLLFALSFYMLYDARASVTNQYNAYLNAARSRREQGIYADAEAYYMSALEVNPTVDLYIEVGEFYIESNQAKKALDWGETTLSVYPKEPKAYEFQTDMLLANRDYTAFFRLANEFCQRGLTSEIISNQLASIEYKFYFNGQFADVGVYSGGLCPVRIGNKWGYVGLTGANAVAALYPKAGAFSSEGLAPVVDSEGNAYFIDTVGNKKFIILNVENVTELGLIENGIYSLYNGTYWGFYDQQYNHLFGEYDAVSAIGNGVAAVQKGGKWSLVNREGQDLTGKTYDDVVMDEKLVVYRYDRLFVNEGSGYQMIDSTGKSYGDTKFQAAHMFYDNTYAAVMVNDKWGFVDASGKMVIKPQYEDARSFANGFAAVQKDGKWGFITTNGEMVIEPQFDNAKDFNNHGCVFVMRDSAWELLRLYKYNY